MNLGRASVIELNSCMFLFLPTSLLGIIMSTHIRARPPILGTSEKMWINYEGITNVIQKGKRVSICCVWYMMTDAVVVVLSSSVLHFPFWCLKLN